MLLAIIIVRFGINYTATHSDYNICYVIIRIILNGQSSVLVYDQEFII